MRISVIAVGKLKRGPESELWDRYEKRFNATAKPLGFQRLTLTELTESRLRDTASRKHAEATAIANKLSDDSTIFACDETGKTLSSNDIAQQLGRLRDDGIRNLAMIIGGPDGLDKKELEAASNRKIANLWSFGRITLPHGLARIVLAEQLYRATTLLSGHPYHRA